MDEAIDSLVAKFTNFRRMYKSHMPPGADVMTSTKQSPTKPCTCLTGYTVYKMLNALFT